MTKLLCVPLAFLLAACGPSQAELQAAAEAEQARIEQAADVLAGQYDEAVANGNWELARIHGAALLAQYPRTAAGLRVQPGFQATQDKASELRELQRLQSLWHYAQVPAPGGTQRSALIYSKNTVDVDGSGPRTVELVFRDHPQWKRSAYLILPTGDFDCYGGCNAKVSADGGPARAMPGYRPDTKEAIAMFINNDKALWRLARNSKAIEIEFPVKAGGTRTVVFESGGLKDEHMPGWD